MRRTYCDSCGGECQGKTGRLILAIEHETSKSEFVGADQFRPLDLCGPCTDEIRTSLGFKLERYGRDYPEMAEGMARVADSPHP